MKRVILHSLTLGHFAGIKSLEIKTGGMDLCLQGMNGTGKSTIASALIWLWTGFDVEGQSLGADIKTLVGDTPMSKTDHWAEATLTVDGEYVTIKKVFREIWTTKRGSANSEFTGHETQCFYDEIPVKENDYLARLEQICPARWLRFLLQPEHFMQRIKSEAMRSVLIEVCGDVSDLDVAASEERFAPLAAILSKRSIDDHRKVLKSRKDPLVEEKKGIPARIDQTQRLMPEFIEGELETQLELRNTRLRDLQAQRAQSSASGAVGDLQNQIRLLSGEAIDIVNAAKVKRDPARAEALKKQADLDGKIREATSKVDHVESRLRQTAGELGGIERQLTDLRAQYRLISAESYSGDGICPTCKQSIPEAEVAARTEAFNTARATKLDANQKQGRALAATKTELTTKTEALGKELESAKAGLAGLQAERSALVIPSEVVVDPAQDPRYIEIQEKLQLIEKQKADLLAGSGSATAEIDAKIARRQTEINEAAAAIRSNQERLRYEQEIEKLSEREKALGAELETIDAEIFLCEDFVRAKVRLLTERINSRFSLCKFTLFQDQINGGLKEVCIVVKKNGIPPSHGESVNCGLDVINAISEHVGVSLPIVIENSEAVSAFLRTTGQQIRLRHDDSIEELEIRTFDRESKRELLFA